MTSKRYLSNKKTSQLTISISPALKDWINRYNNKLHKKFPDDKRYKSTSSFICSVIENVLKIFEKEKSLDDFQKLTDKEVENLFSQNTTLYSPFVELSLVMDSLMPIDSIINTKFFFSYYKFYLKNIDPYDIDSVKLFYERIKNRYLYTNITKYINIEILTKKDYKDYEAILEQSSNYKYLQITNVKISVALLGILGVRVVDVYYSEEEEYYFRIKLAPTDLWFDKREDRKERISLAKQNVNFIVNLSNTVEHESPHLWQKLAEDNDVIVCFINKEVQSKWIKRLEDDLNKFSNKGAILLKILKFFERLHWIRIENEEKLEFQLRLLEEKNSTQIDFLKDYLSKFAKVSKQNHRYYLEQIK
ncbi:MAG: hypothetical protein ACFE85_02370 [Candidatus Hodarchaeota archaeon]